MSLLQKCADWRGIIERDPKPTYCYVTISGKELLELIEAAEMLGEVRGTLGCVRWVEGEIQLRKRIDEALSR